MSELYMPLIIMAFTFLSVFLFLYFLIFRDQIKISKLEEKIQREIVKGNKNAILIYKQGLFINKNKIMLIENALNGNESALQALGIKSLCDIEERRNK